MMKSRIVFLTVNVIFPLLVGGLIYVCLRPRALLMFAWSRTLGIERSIMTLRGMALPLNSLLPQWALFSLPDGLWVYALTAFMARLWLPSKPSLPKFLWLSAGLLLGAGSEFGQLFGLLPGKFDLSDLAFSFVAFFAAFAIAKASITQPSLLSE